MVFKTRQKQNRVKFFRCPDPDCGVFCTDMLELQEHMDMLMHCPECGFVLAGAAKTHRGYLCPACDLGRNEWPGSRTQVT